MSTSISKIWISFCYTRNKKVFGVRIFTSGDVDGASLSVEASVVDPSALLDARKGCAVEEGCWEPAAARRCPFAAHAREDAVWRGGGIATEAGGTGGFPPAPPAAAAAGAVAGAAVGPTADGVLAVVVAATAAVVE